MHMHSGGSCGVQMPHKELVVHYHPARGVWVVLKGGFKGEVWSTAHSIRNARINNLESWHNARINRQNRQRKMANICGGKYSYVHVANGEPKSENRKHQWKKLFPNKLRKKTKQKEDGKKKNKKKHCSIFGVGRGVEVGVPLPNTEFCALHENIAQFYFYCSQCWISWDRPWNK